MEEAKKTIEEWRMNYNDFRPRRSLGGVTPEEFTRQWQAKNNSQNTQKLSQEPLQFFGGNIPDPVPRGHVRVHLRDDVRPGEVRA